MPKILVVEDDLDVAKMIKEWLGYERHTIELVNNGIEAKHRIREAAFDIVILDWELPGCSGIDILNDIRGQGIDVSIIMLTAHGQVKEKEQILDAGADDYITKPFHMKELSARVRAVLRRAAGRSTNCFRAADIELDPKKYKVTKAGAVIHLQRTEFALLEFFMRHPGQVFTVEALLERVWGADTESSVEAIRSCVKRLRKKLDDDAKPAIVTVHGVGYLFDPN